MWKWINKQIVEAQTRDTFDCQSLKMEQTWVNFKAQTRKKRTLMNVHKLTYNKYCRKIDNSCKEMKKEWTKRMNQRVHINPKI